MAESRSGAIVRYRAWLERQREIGAGWFKVYDSVTGRIIQYIRQPAEAVEDPYVEQPPPRIELQSVRA